MMKEADDMYYLLMGDGWRVEMAAQMIKTF